MDYVINLLHNIAAQLNRIETQQTSRAQVQSAASIDMLDLASTMRRTRDKAFPKPYFSDAAWELLLDAHAAEKKQKKISITDLGLSADIPQSTTLRYIERLEQDGYLIRTPDVHDKRRVFISLSEAGRKAMDMIAQEGERWLSQQGYTKDVVFITASKNETNSRENEGKMTNTSSVFL
jgi:DNA-binding MarR family transcriptional regulator